MERAIEFEARRQIELLEEGGKVEQETRLYDPDRDETRSMRTKEDAHDYRYFPDPDLLPLIVTEEQIKKIGSTLPELPSARRERYQESFLMFPQDAEVLTSSRELSDYFEQVLTELGSLREVPYGVQTPDMANAKSVANWVINDLNSLLNRDNLSASLSPITPRHLAELLRRLFDKTISGKIAKEVFDAMWAGEGAADAIIERRGLRQISDAGAIERLIEEVLAANPKQVEDYRAGKEKAFNSLVGQVMKASKGKANPQQVNEVLRRKLSG
jgi:aspartyl-tRNA(Asn)/glutamyl-tRNA(Gln) amidotransferase subunit B